MDNNGSIVDSTSPGRDGTGEIEGTTQQQSKAMVDVRRKKVHTMKECEGGEMHLSSFHN